MFTGLVEAVGTIVSAETTPHGRAVSIEAPELVPLLAVGDSVAVSGVCLTVERTNGRMLVATAVAETLARTTLGSLEPGARVNLERAASAERLFGGHFVQGHVDAVGRVIVFDTEDTAGAGRWLDVALTPELHEICVEKGSIAIDGMSLTIARCLSDAGVRIAVVPHTLRATIAADYRRGTRVNVEADMIARHVREYVRRMYSAAR